MSRIEAYKIVIDGCNIRPYRHKGDATNYAFSLTKFWDTPHMPVNHPEHGWLIQGNGSFYDHDGKIPGYMVKVLSTMFHPWENK